MNRVLYAALGLVLVGVIAVAALTLLGPSQPLAETPPDQDPALLNTRWTLTSLNGDTPLSAITIRFTADGLYGISGCNNYHSPYDARDGHIRFGILAFTMALCSPVPEIYQQLASYQETLSRVTVYHVEGDTLTLGTRFHPDALTFSRAP